MPADIVLPDALQAEFSPDEVRDLLGREAARRHGRDFDRALMTFELARETHTDGTESLSGARVTLRWSGAAPTARAAPAVEAVGADL